MKMITKQISAILIASAVLTGCATTTNDPQPNEQTTGMTKTQQGALIGGILGAVIGGASKGNNKAKRVLIGGALGAAIGGGIGYSMDQQAKEIAEELNTNVNNNPDALADASNDLVISNTDEYVKIMLRNSAVFKTNSSVPTQEAASKISKISEVLKNYPDTLVQVVGFTDSRGSYEYNQTLSEKRAANVGNTLYNSGIANKVFSKGCSYNKPLVVNSSSENMALNRRVEIYLYANQEAIIDPCKN